MMKLRDFEPDYISAPTGPRSLQGRSGFQYSMNQMKKLQMRCKSRFDVNSKQIMSNTNTN